MITQIHDYSSDSAGNHSAEVTTVSGPLLTDRTLALRALEEVSSVLLTGLCRRAVIQYNATFEEMNCVCFGQCPWRAPTEQEKEMVAEMDEFRRIIAYKRRLRKIIMGIAYSAIFILGATGMISQLFITFKGAN